MHQICFLFGDVSGPKVEVDYYLKSMPVWLWLLCTDSVSEDQQVGVQLFMPFEACSSQSG